MRVKAIRTARQPKYPTRDKIALNPRLANLTPRRWRSNHHVLAALSIVGVSASISLAQELRPIPGVIAPSHFLTEREALGIIRDEAKKVGLKLVHKGKHITVPVPSKDGKTKTDKSYCLDETDPKSGVSIDFLSYDDADRFYGTPMRKTPTLYAKDIAKSIKNKKIMIVAESGYGTSEEQANKLRKDLREFFKWLKSQGVI